jgi:hypothetical protein
MRSRCEDIPAFLAVARALKHQIVGVGGRLGVDPGSLAEAVAAVADQHGERLARRLDRFASAPDGAYVWTRDSEGALWLGRLAGAWRYDPSSQAHDVDLVHVRPCHWLSTPVPDRLVPPAVHATFARGGRNWQQTHDADVSRISAMLWDDVDHPSA